mgnify:CR=1 FL=1
MRTKLMMAVLFVTACCPFAVYEYAKQNCRKRIQTDAQSGEKFRNIHIMVKGVCSRKEDNPN